jgi:phosphatidylserine decarboxylase
VTLDRAGLPFVLAALGPAALLLLLGYALWAIPFGLLLLVFLFFFRDPDRQVPDTPGAVVSPADGRVLHAGEAVVDVAPPGRWQQISIFLSPADVHVNRVPIAGRVTRVEHRPGTFLPAFREHAARDNERSEVWIRHGGQDVVCRQVVGVMARRVVCRVAEGAEVRTGDRFGIMKFGSRIDLFLPVTAVLRVRPGERVRGGETIVAMLTPLR